MPTTDGTKTAQDVRDAVEDLRSLVGQAQLMLRMHDLTRLGDALVKLDAGMFALVTEELHDDD